MNDAQHKVLYRSLFVVGTLALFFFFSSFGFLTMFGLVIAIASFGAGFYLRAGRRDQ